MKRIGYYSPHMLTLMGLGFAAAGLICLFEGRIDAAVRYSLLVLVVDRADGTLARSLKVRERIPGVSGEVLDIITDLVGLTFVPMMIFLRTGLFMDGFGVVLAILAPIAAAWKYSRKESFLADGYSRGAPPVFFSIFLFYFLELPPVYPTIYTALLIILTVSPVKYPITNLVTTHWKPGYKSLTNWLTAIFLIPVFIFLKNTPDIIFIVMLAAIGLQLLIDPLLLRFRVLQPVHDREY